MNKYVETAISYLAYCGGSICHVIRGTGKKEERPAFLILRPDFIGDLVCTVPFLRELRRNYPDARIDLVCSPLTYNMMVLCPYIDDLYVYDRRARKHKFLTNLKRAIRLVGSLKSSYDCSIVPAYASPDGYPEAWIGFFAGIPRRISYSEKVDPRKHSDYMGSYDVFFNDICYSKAVHHEVESGLGLLRHMNLSIEKDGLELWSDAADQETVEQLIRQNQLGDAVRIAVNLSTSNKTKDWPVEKYIEVCQRLEQNYKVDFLLIGAGEAAKEYSGIFCRKLPLAHDFVNQTTIRETYELLRRTDLYLGGDTGPMHLAAVCKLHGVVIYKTAKNMKGIAPHQWFAPWQAEIEIVQPERPLPGCENGCEKEQHCISLVTTDAVYQSIAAQIDSMWPEKKKEAVENAE